MLNGWKPFLVIIEDNGVQTGVQSLPVMQNKSAHRVSYIGRYFAATWRDLFCFRYRGTSKRHGNNSRLNTTFIIPVSFFFIGDEIALMATIFGRANTDLSPFRRIWADDEMLYKLHTDKRECLMRIWQAQEQATFLRRRIKQQSWGCLAERIRSRLHAKRAQPGPDQAFSNSLTSTTLLSSAARLTARITASVRAASAASMTGVAPSVITSRKWVSWFS